MLAGMGEENVSTHADGDEENQRCHRIITKGQPAQRDQPREGDRITFQGSRRSEAQLGKFMRGELEDVLGETHLQKDLGGHHAGKGIEVTLNFRSQIAKHQRHGDGAGDQPQQLGGIGKKHRAVHARPATKLVQMFEHHKIRRMVAMTASASMPA